MKMNSLGKNILTGALFLGGLAAGLLGANFMANASEKMQTKDLDESLDVYEIPSQQVETLKDVVDLVKNNGTQIILDEETGDLFVSFLNDDNEVEISDITEDELNNLIETVNAINTGETSIEELI